jgi:hypothetical protein
MVMVVPTKQVTRANGSRIAYLFQHPVAIIRIYGPGRPSGLLYTRPRQVPALETDGTKNAFISSGRVNGAANPGKRASEAPERSQAPIRHAEGLPIFRNIPHSSFGGPGYPVNTDTSGVLVNPSHRISRACSG